MLCYVAKQEKCGLCTDLHNLQVLSWNNSITVWKASYKILFQFMINIFIKTFYVIVSSFLTYTFDRNVAYNFCQKIEIYWSFGFINSFVIPIYKYIFTVCSLIIFIFYTPVKLPAQSREQVPPRSPKCRRTLFNPSHHPLSPQETAPC